MDKETKSSTTKVVLQDYALNVLSNVLEMVRYYFGIIYQDKKLNSLYTSLLDYINSNLTEIDGDVIESVVSIMVQK